MKLPKNENLKLARDSLSGKKLNRPEVTATGIIDYDVEMTCFRKRLVKCLFN